MFSIAPDTQQNIFVAIYLLILHNYQVLFFAGALGISIVAALIKPTRSRVLLIVGFSMLALAFEYSKHIQDALLEQTRQSLITQRQSVRLEYILTVSLQKLAPLTLRTIGVLATVLGLVGEIMGFVNKRKQ